MGSDKNDRLGLLESWKRTVRGALLYGNENDLDRLRTDTRNDLGRSGLTLADTFDVDELVAIDQTGLYQSLSGGDVVRRTLGYGAAGAVAGATGVNLGSRALARRPAQRAGVAAARAGRVLPGIAGRAAAGTALKAGSGPVGAVGTLAGGTLGAAGGVGAGLLSSLYHPEITELNVADWFNEFGGVDATKTQLEQSDFGAIVAQSSQNSQTDANGATSYTGDHDYLNGEVFQTSIARATLGSGGQPVSAEDLPGGGARGLTGDFQPVPAGTFANPELETLYNAIGSAEGTAAAVQAITALGSAGGAFGQPSYEQLLQQQNEATARENTRLDQQRQDALHQVNTGFAIDRERLGLDETIAGNQLHLGNRAANNAAQQTTNQLHLGNRQADNQRDQIANALTLGREEITGRNTVASTYANSQLAQAIQAANAQRHVANQGLAGSNYAADQTLEGVRDTNRANYNIAALDASIRGYEVDTRTAADQAIATTQAGAATDVANTQAGRFAREGARVDRYGNLLQTVGGEEEGRPLTLQESDLDRYNQALIARINAGQTYNQEGTVQAADREAALRAAEYNIDNAYGLAAFTGGGGAGLERGAVLNDIARILALQGSGGTASTPAQAAEQNQILARIQASGGLSDPESIRAIQELEATDNAFSFAQRQFDAQQASAQQFGGGGQTRGNRGVRQGEVFSPAFSQGNAIDSRQDASLQDPGVQSALDVLRDTQLAANSPAVRGQTLDFLSNPAGLGAAVQLGGSDYVNQLLGQSGLQPSQAGAGAAGGAGAGAGGSAGGRFNIKQLADQALLDSFNDPNKLTDGFSIFGAQAGQNLLGGQSQSTFNQLSQPQQDFAYGSAAALGQTPDLVQRQLNQNTPNARQNTRTNRFQTV